MPHTEELEALLEAKRCMDRKFERFVELYTGNHGKLRRIDLGHYLDRARTEIELTEHWLDRLMETLERATVAATRASPDKPAGA